MAENYGDLLAQEIAKRHGPPVATTTALNALPADSKPDGQIRCVLADYSFWTYRAATSDWVPLGNGNVGPEYVQEWTNAAAVSTTALKTATATTVAAQTILAAALTTQGKADLAAYPRNVTFTSGGADATHAPASAVITGTDIDDAALTETVTLSQTAGTDLGIKAFKTITSIVYGAGGGTDATVAIGLGGKLGLAKKPKVRAGGVGVKREIANAVVVSTGTFVIPTTSPPYGTYAPSSAPNGTNDYAVYFERDLT